MCFNSDSSILTAGTFKGEILNFNIPSMSKSNAKMQLNSKITSIKYSPFYSNYIASSFVDGSVKIIDTNSGNVLNNFTGYHQGAATGICFSPINKLFLSSVSADNRINFYDILAKKHIKTINTTYPLTSISFHTDGQTIAVGSTNGTISIYDLRYSSSPKLIISDHNTAINHLEFSMKSTKSQNPNASLNNSKLDLNSSRVNKSFDSQEVNIGFPLQNQLNHSQFQSSMKENFKVTADNKINVETNKSKISGSEKLGESYNNLFRENSNLNKPNTNEKNSNKPPLPNSQIINRDRTSFDSEGEQKQIKKIDNSNIISNKVKTLNFNNTNAKDDLENQTQIFIKSLIDTEMRKMKQFIHEEINSLHIDLIRQFQIQHVKFFS
jgi:protein NEDD1